MVIIGGDADGNEEDVFSLFSVSLCFFAFLIRVLEVSPFAGTRSVLLIASHALHVVFSGERKFR